MKMKMIMAFSGFLAGVVCAIAFFKFSRLSFLIQLHGLKGARMDPGMVICNLEHPDSKWVIPEGVYLYEIDGSFENFERYIMFVNVEGRLLNSSKVDFISPSIAYPVLAP